MHTGIREARAHTRFERQTSDGNKIWRTDYFGPPPSPASSNSLRPDAPNTSVYTPPAAGEIRDPQAFLVEQSPGAIVHPHFHYVDQFQVVVDGGGTLGRHDVSPISVHFASAHTGYGPITPGPEGLKYFTLRASADETGAQYLPANRHKMLTIPKKNVLLDSIPLADPDELRQLAQVRRSNVKQDESGLRVDVVSIPPGMQTEISGQPKSAVLMILVISGSVLLAEQTFTPWSCMFIGNHEPGALLTGGPDGAQILALQFPMEAS